MSAAVSSVTPSPNCAVHFISDVLRVDRWRTALAAGAETDSTMLSTFIRPRLPAICRMNWSNATWREEMKFESEKRAVGTLRSSTRIGAAAVVGTPVLPNSAFDDVAVAVAVGAVAETVSSRLTVKDVAVGVTGACVGIGQPPSPGPQSEGPPQAAPSLLDGVNSW